MAPIIPRICYKMASVLAFHSVLSLLAAKAKKGNMMGYRFII